MKTTTMMMFLASSAALSMAATTPAPAPTTGGVTPATSGIVLCKVENVQSAWTAVKTDAKASGKKCADDAGVTETALETMVGVMPAQFDLIAKSTNCATYYTFVLKTLKSIQPPCALTLVPKRTTTADMAAFTIQEYTAFFKDLSSSATGSNTMTSVPGVATTSPTSVSSATGSATGQSTKAPAPKPSSSASCMTTSFVTLAAVAVVVN